jgi:hypothetical protein
MMCLHFLDSPEIRGGVIEYCIAIGKQRASKVFLICEEYVDKCLRNGGCDSRVH